MNIFLFTLKEKKQNKGFVLKKYIFIMKHISTEVSDYFLLWWMDISTFGPYLEMKLELSLSVCGV